MTLQDCIRDSGDENISPIDVGSIKNLTLNNVRMINHQRTGNRDDGGAIWMDNIEYALFRDVVFDNNGNTGRGGAVYANR